HLVRRFGQALARCRASALLARLSLLAGLALLAALPGLRLLAFLLSLLLALRALLLWRLARLAARSVLALLLQLLCELARLLAQPFLLTRQAVEPALEFLGRQLVLLAGERLLLACQVVLPPGEFTNPVERRILFVLGARLDVAALLVL